MKKKLFLLAGLMFIFSVSVEAKYVYPEGATTTSERRVNRRIKKYDTDQDGGLTFDEYQKYREVRTRDERRMERRAKKKGTYVSPRDAFDAMDSDGDGTVSREEMTEYEKSLR